MMNNPLQDLMKQVGKKETAWIRESYELYGKGKYTHAEWVGLILQNLIGERMQADPYPKAKKLPAGEKWYRDKHLALQTVSSILQSFRIGDYKHE